MPFVNEKLTEEQRKEFLNRKIKRPWSERIANPIYRTIDAKRNMCLWELGNLGRDYFDHYMFLFDWNGEERFAIPVYDNAGELVRYNVFKARILVRHAKDGKLYLYDILRTKKRNEQAA